MFSKSPMFVPVKWMLTGSSGQSSYVGSTFPICVPSTIAELGWFRISPWLLPLIRLTAPTCEGPKVVPNELSLIEKCWA